jgi:hypothetical protein
MTPSLLFHELVYLIQYRQLGIPAFANRYVNGFLAGGGYNDLPLERCAYELDARFIGRTAFSVEAEVAAWIRGKRFISCR